MFEAGYVPSEGEWRVIVPPEFPTITYSFNELRADSGLRCAPHGCDEYVPQRWEDRLAVIEDTLSALSTEEPAREDLEARDRIIREGFSDLDSEFWTFICGEHTAQIAITQRSWQTRMTNKFLNDFFDGWIDD